MTIPDDVVAEIMAKSARHCCLCQQFFPLHIQLHHIVERNDGGTDDPDNLIPICIICHSAVHAATKMTKGFTANELKMRRQRLFDLVKDGKIPGTRPLSSVELQAMKSS